MPTETQSTEYEYVMHSGMGEYLCNEHSFSGWHEGVYCVGAAGILNHGGGRGEAWYLLSKTAAPHMHCIISKTRSVLETSGFRRIEMTVKVGNVTGDKIAKLLRFKKEAVLEAYHPDGGDMTLYKRIKR